MTSTQILRSNAKSRNEEFKYKATSLMPSDHNFWYSNFGNNICVYGLWFVVSLAWQWIDFNPLSFYGNQVNTMRPWMQPNHYCWVGHKWPSNCAKISWMAVEFLKCIFGSHYFKVLAKWIIIIYSMRNAYKCSNKLIRISK